MTTPELLDALTAAAVKAGLTPRPVTPGVVAYRTRGNSLIFAADGKHTRSGLHRDAALILPAPLPAHTPSGVSRVVPLVPHINPEFLVALRAAFDPTPTPEEIER